MATEPICIEIVKELDARPAVGGAGYRYISLPYDNPECEGIGVWDGLDCRYLTDDEIVGERRKIMGAVMP